ncbi:MAG: tetratricopeptide repeat protein [Blastocatellia bacterium]
MIQPNSQQPLGNAAFAVCALLLIAAVAVSTAIGCGWSFATEHSVRFTGYSAKSEFTRLPPLPINLEARRKKAPVSQALDEEAEYEAVTRREAEMDDLWVRAGDAEQQGNYALSARLLREYLQRSVAEYDGGWWDAAPLQLRRNSAVDRLDALTALGQGAKPAALSAYLALRREYDQAMFGEKQPEAPVSFDPLREKMVELKLHPALADNAAYLHAATLYREEKTDEAMKAFSELANKHRHSEKREAALLMAGRVKVNRFEQSLQEADNEQDRARQRARQSARETLQQCLRDYPRGRFAPDARGWLARLWLLEGDRAAALAEYYRLLAEAIDPISRESLLTSLRLTRHHATDEEMRQVEAALANEFAAALTYAYHNLYNYAPNAGYYRLDCEGQYYEMEDQKREDFSRRAEREEKARVVAFANKLLMRYPHAAIGAGFALRLAQAQLEQGEHRAALQSSTRALQLGARDRERTEALWVKGSSEFHLGNYAAARRTLGQLRPEFPDSDLAEGAGRLVAMAAEDAGDLDGALEQYIALGYDNDIAYFIDVLMTPEQLAGFIARHPASPRLNELNYALAVRYLRGSRWSEAGAALAKVKVTEEGDGYYEREETDDPVEFRSSGRTAKVPSDAAGIAARWLWRDQKTIEDLQRLQADADLAQGDEAKAEAFYQLASYLYQSSSLLFYNPSLWGGSRHYKLEEIASNNSYRAPGEAQLLRQHMQEHEPVAHALEIYLEIVRRFPATRAARDALYTAAVCHERLSDYNGYWRDLYGMGMHAGARLVTYEDLRREYPGYQLPRGTIGWEPRTRTVNGGAGWADPPKPAPRLSRRARLKQQLADSFVELRRKQQETVAWLTALWNGLVTGLIYSVLAVILLAACYFTTMGLYLKNQQPSHTALFENERIDAAPPERLSPTDSPVEKLINDP